MEHPPPPPTIDEPLTPVRVWDLPTRLFHWVLAVCVIGSVVSAHIGGNAMDWHFRCGYVVFTLLLFRLVWGLIGGRWSRFVHFLYAPATLWGYLRGAPRAGVHLEVGHNPLGALSVFALLGLLVVQVGTGLVADDEIASTGPLVKFVSSATSLALTAWHKSLGQYLIVTLVVLHVVAVFYYLLRKKRNLVRPMVSGDKLLPAGVPASVDNARARGLAVVVLLLCGAFVRWVVSLGA